MPAIVEVTTVVFYPIFGLLLPCCVGGPTGNVVLARLQLDGEDKLSPCVGAEVRADIASLVPHVAPINGDLMLGKITGTPHCQALYLDEARADFLVGLAGVGDPRFDGHLPDRVVFGVALFP